jgi:homoserine O-acetyltransferase
MTTQLFHANTPFSLECGASLPQLDIAYTVHGCTLNQQAPVLWICHALTANADPASWWGNLVGPNKAFDTNQYTIVCANILGSCYGTTGPESINPTTQQPYYSDFPLVTIRDMVRAHQLLRQHLGIDQIDVLVGGSMGGYQCLEWALLEPARINRLFLLATSAEETAWGIAIHTAQRLAIEADPAFHQRQPDGGKAGLAAARAMGMITYRTYNALVHQQQDPDLNKLDGYQAESYIRYQGQKLVKRFSAYAYHTLTRSMDSHRIHRGYTNTVEERLVQIHQPTLIIGIQSDVLCPPNEQHKMAEAMPSTTFHLIDSEYGHDGFLVEHQQIESIFEQWRNANPPA